MPRVLVPYSGRPPLRGVVRSGRPLGSATPPEPVRQWRQREAPVVPPGFEKGSFSDRLPRCMLRQVILLFGRPRPRSHRPVRRCVRRSPVTAGGRSDAAADGWWRPGPFNRW